MKTNIKNVFSIGFCMFGTLVGAGFASGKEIWVYFAKWGSISYLMIFLTSIWFFFCSLLFFYFGKKFQITTVQEANNKLYKKFSFISEIMVAISNILVLSSMFAGADSLLFSVMPNMPYRIASVISAAIAVLVVCFGFSGVTKTNAIIVPLMLLCVGVIFAFKLGDGNLLISAQHSTKLQAGFGFLYAFLFVCSNMFLSGFIFAKMGATYAKKEFVWGSALGSALLMLSLFIITLLLFLCPEATTQDIPIVFMGASLNKQFGFFVLFVVWLGLLSTAFALLFTLTNWLKEYIKSTPICATLVVIISLLLSGIGFSSFVSFVYPSLGVLGLIYIIATMVACFKKKNLTK